MWCMVRFTIAFHTSPSPAFQQGPSMPLASALSWMWQMTHPRTQWFRMLRNAKECMKRLLSYCRARVHWQCDTNYCVTCVQQRLPFVINNACLNAIRYTIMYTNILRSCFVESCYKPPFLQNFGQLTEAGHDMCSLTAVCLGSMLWMMHHTLVFILQNL